MTGTNIRPGKPCPPLDIALLDGDRLNVRKLPQDGRTLLIVYRGKHCPKCKQQLREVDQSIKQFADLGIRPVAISMDDEQATRKSREEWGIKNLPMGCGLSEATARDWGLFISRAEFDYEPRVFSEPGLFLIENDGTLYAAWIQSSPFSRPRCEDLIKDLEFVEEKNYPARGKAA